MYESNLGVVETKVLSALLALADKDKYVYATTIEIATKIGYKKSGGAITFAIRLLESKKIIRRVGQRRFKILL